MLIVLRSTMTPTAISLAMHAGLSGAEIAAESIRQKVESLMIPHQNSPVKPHITISIGVASCVAMITIDKHRLIDEADKVLYEAKRTGRNKVVSKFVE